MQWIVYPGEGRRHKETGNNRTCSQSVGAAVPGLLGMALLVGASDQGLRYPHGYLRREMDDRLPGELLADDGSGDESGAEGNDDGLCSP